MASNRFVTGAALVGAAASVLAAGLVWLVATGPEALAVTLALWLGAR